MPKKIKWNDVIWKYNKDEKEYYSQRTNEAFFNYTSSVGLWIMAHLNDTVEIIEEKHDINIQNIEELQFNDNSNIRDTRDLLINELVQAVKQLDQNKQDKE